MCETCGCNVTPANSYLLEPHAKFSRLHASSTPVEILNGLLSENDHQAVHNRQHLDSNGVFTVNLMSSPGAGKTALLEATIERLKQKFAIAVIEGDLETENDAQRIRAKGVTAVQIATGTACHLDAHMVHNALHQLDLSALDLLFIENVGNLVCPASFDLGHHQNVALLSVTEGDDKPAKYPVMFRTANAMVLSKMDILPYMDFSPDAAQQALRNLANSAPVIRVSAKSGAGMDAWIDWLMDQVERFRNRLEQGHTLLPGINDDSGKSRVSAQFHKQE